MLVANRVANRIAIFWTASSQDIYPTNRSIYVYIYVLLLIPILNLSIPIKQYFLDKIVKG